MQRAVGVMVAVVLVGASARAEDAVLRFGTSAQGLAVPGVEQTHLLDAAAGTALHLQLDHGHLDVELRVLGPDGALLGAIENVLSGINPLTLTVVVQQTGTQQVVIRLRSKRAHGGPYQVTIGPESAATDADRTRMGAERLRADADHHVASQDGATFPRALDAYRGSAELWHLLDDGLELAITLSRQGELLELMGRQPEARTVLEEALVRWRQVGDASGESDCLDGLGLVVTELGDPRGGLARLEQALALRRKAGPLPYAEGSILNDMAIALGNMGELQQAIDRYTEAFALARQDGDEEAQAQVLRSRASDYRALGDDARALFDLREARAKFQALGNAREGGVSDYSIGITLSDAGRTTEAWGYFQSALGLLARTGDERFTAFTLEQMGLVQLEARRYDEATATFEQALAKLEAGGDRRSSANLRMNLARTLLERGRPRESLEPLASARDELHATGDRGREAVALTYLARAEVAVGLLERARQHVVEALQLTEDIRASIVGPSARATYVAAVHARYELLVSVLMALHARDPAHGWDAEALAASETSRARSLLEVLADARADTRADVDPALKVSEDGLAVRLGQARRAQEALLSRPHSSEEADRVALNLAEIRAEEERLQARMRATSPRYASLAAPASLTLAEIQALVLDPSTSLVEYFVGERDSFVWVVSQTQLVSSRLPGRRDLERAVAAVYRLWSNPVAVDDGARAARALSSLVLGPVASAVKGERLLVVADGALQQIPFAALPAPGSSRPLLEDHTLVSLPSASVLAVLTASRGEAPQGGPELVILADPLLGNGVRGLGPASNAVAMLAPGLLRSLEDSGLRTLERLPGTRLEAEAIAAHVLSGRVLTALGADASRATALGPEVSQARIVHFATHALLDVRRPEFSGIVLSQRDASGRPQDGYLSLADVYRLRLSAELVVLSACRTGLGKVVRGEGLVGLTRGFMYAGAPRVVASLWKVSDRATLALMDRFYALMLDQKLSPAEALRAAQRSLRRDRRYTSPYAWAGFVLQGDWHALPPRP